jgi:hypothetical protein
MVNVDGIPDVYLGKLLCNNVQEVNIVVDKIIKYKKYNIISKKILQMGGDSFTDDNINEGEYANTKVMEKLPGYTTTQLWASTETLTKFNIRQGFHASPDFTDFCGHGSQVSVATHPPKDHETWVPPPTEISPFSGFLTWDFDAYLFMNKQLPVSVYKSCSGSKYNLKEQCFAWKHLSVEGAGSIATYGAAGISYGSTGVNIIKICTGWMEQKSFELFPTVKIFGQVWGESISGYYTYFEANLGLEEWKTICEWSLFGDPTLAVENGIESNVRSVNNPMPILFERIIGRFPSLEKILLPVLLKLMSNR